MNCNGFTEGRRNPPSLKKPRPNFSVGDAKYEPFSDESRATLSSGNLLNPPITLREKAYEQSFPNIVKQSGCKRFFGVNELGLLGKSFSN